jgi:hypothetical protein
MRINSGEFREDFEALDQALAARGRENGSDDKKR